MRAWIRKSDLHTYTYLCTKEGYEPAILEWKNDIVHVDMSANTAQTWNMMGYWYQMG
jgi:hypothetical protein